MARYAFLSYQTADKGTAGRLRQVLAQLGIRSFLAHEDINVSDEWRLTILEEIAKVDIFICLLSKNYIQSAWCAQESGIAAFRAVPVIPLSLDGTIPPGFIAHLQSVRINSDDIALDTLMPAFLKHDFPLAIEFLVKQVGEAGNFRGAETHFQKILPHIHKMSNEQIKALLERSAENNQVHHASLCATSYIPPLLASHGHLLMPDTLAFLKQVCAQYA